MDAKKILMEAQLAAEAAASAKYDDKITGIPRRRS